MTAAERWAHRPRRGIPRSSISPGIAGAGPLARAGRHHIAGVGHRCACILPACESASCGARFCDLAARSFCILERVSTLHDRSELCRDKGNCRRSSLDATSFDPSTRRCPATPCGFKPAQPGARQPPSGVSLRSPATSFKNLRHLQGQGQCSNSSLGGHKLRFDNKSLPCDLSTDRRSPGQPPAGCNACAARQQASRNHFYHFASTSTNAAAATSSEPTIKCCPAVCQSDHRLPGGPGGCGARAARQQA